MPYIKGKIAVAEALQADISIQHILIATNNKHHPDFKTITSQAAQKGIPVQWITKDQLQQKEPSGQTQGVLALTKEIQTKDIKTLNPETHPVIIALDHLEDPYNMGAIMRTCECLGIKAILFAKDRQVQLTPGVIKVSSGAAYHLDLVKVSNLAQALKQLQNKGYWIYGTIVEDGESLENITLNRPMVLVVGNERKGMSTNIQKLMDNNISIPMKGKINSLNVSVTTAIILYKIATGA